MNNKLTPFFWKFHHKKFVETFFYIYVILKIIFPLNFTVSRNSRKKVKIIFFFKLEFLHSFPPKIDFSNSDNIRTYEYVRILYMAGGEGEGRGRLAALTPPI